MKAWFAGSDVTTNYDLEASERKESIVMHEGQRIDYVA